VTDDLPADGPSQISQKADERFGNGKLGERGSDKCRVIKSIIGITQRKLVEIAGWTSGPRRICQPGAKDFQGIVVAVHDCLPKG
jgi:hypothetical protein